MTKESQATTRLDSVSVQQKRVRLNKDYRTTASPVGIAMSSAAASGALERQAASLQRLGKHQRIMTLAQISRIQGNRHAQRLVDAALQLSPVGANERVLSVQERSDAAVQRGNDEERPTFEYFNLSDVLDAKRNMEGRFHDVAEYGTIARRVGALARTKLLHYSATYRGAYADYAAAIRAARAEAQNQNRWLGIVIGAATNAAAAFILPSTAAGWFTLTAAEAATALGSGGVQAGVAVGLGSLIEFSGSNLEPGGLSPEAQQLPIWRTVAGLYASAARQIDTLRNLHGIVRSAEYLIGEIRVQVAGGLPTMTEEQVLDQVETLIRADQAMARQDAALAHQLTRMEEFEAQITALDPRSYSQNQMEQDIWILWMAELSDASVLDLDEIEDRLHSIRVLGPGSRLGIDFGWYTSSSDEDEARDAARTEAVNIRQRMRQMHPEAPD